MKNLTENTVAVLRNGYDIPVYGLNTPRFYGLHIPSIVCLTFSLACAITAFVVSFRRHKGTSFFHWVTCDRFIVYLAICDGALNLPHCGDHLQVAITKDHIYPPVLCQFYGFMVAVFASSQNILVGIIAINIFAMMYFNKKLYFGKLDWILLAIVYGVPIAGGITAWCLGYLGPNGVVCLVDGVKGQTVFSLFFTVPLLVILAMNSLLYLLTWLKINSEVRKIKCKMGQDPPSRKAARRAAKFMSLFVAAFFIQWWSTGLYGAWELFEKAPDVLLHTCTIFPNIGGALNLGVYVMINKKRHSKGKDNTTLSTLRNIETCDKCDKGFQENATMSGCHNRSS